MSSQPFYTRLSTNALVNGSQCFFRFKCTSSSTLKVTEKGRTLFRNESLARKVSGNGSCQGLRSFTRPLTTGPKHDFAHEVNKAGYRRPLTYEEQVKKGVPFGKRRLNQHQSQMAVQAVVGMTMLVGLVVSPFLGRKLAIDPPDWLPQWYDFRVEQEKGMTRDEFQDMFIEMQQELHNRAIKGEFHPDKLDRIDWSKEDHTGANLESKEPITADARMKRDLEISLARQHGWDKLQPLDDEEEYEEVELEVAVDEKGNEIQPADAPPLNLAADLAKAVPAGGKATNAAVDAA